MSEAAVNQRLTPWHRFLARSFEETIGRERVVVKSESPIGSEPPKDVSQGFEPLAAQSRLPRVGPSASSGQTVNV